MKTNLFLIFVLLLWMYFVAVELARADFPPNSLSYPVGAPNAARTTKAQVDGAVKLVREAYANEMKSKIGCKLVITNAWNSSEVNAYASQGNGNCYVEFMGGFARHPKMTYGAVMDVLCHEVGHHLGGAPVYSDSRWASCEGQSDYFAQRCMKRILGSQEAMKAGLVLGEVLADFGNDPKPQYNTPDTRKARGIYCAHPAAQCRVDTYLAGIMNVKRPACWYNP